MVFFTQLSGTLKKSDNNSRVCEERPTTAGIMDLDC